MTNAMNIIINICSAVGIFWTAMTAYKGIKFVLISPEELKLPSYVKKDIIEKSQNIKRRKTNINMPFVWQLETRKKSSEICWKALTTKIIQKMK